MMRVAIAGACAGCFTTPNPPVCTGAYGAPQPLAVFNTDYAETGPWLARDRTEIVFGRNLTGNVQLFRSRRASPLDAWPPATAIPFSTGEFDDRDPFVTADGLTLWFTTQRPNGHAWTATRSSRDAEFDDPKPVAELKQVYAVSLTDDQLDIYYQYSPLMMTTGIYTQHREHATDPFQAIDGVAVTGIGNLSALHLSPAISGDGGVLLYELVSQYRLFRATGGAPPAFDASDMFGDSGDHDASLVDDDAIVFVRAPGGQDDLYFMERSCK